MCYQKADYHGFCKNCAADFDSLITSVNVCPICAAISPLSQVCGKCIKQTPKIDELWSSYNYTNPLKYILHQYKYNGMMQFSHNIKYLMLKNTPKFRQEINFDAIIAMPLSRERLFEHGFHHCLELAKIASSYYQIPILPLDTITREHRKPQAGLDKKSRQSNLKNAFSIQYDVSAKNFLIVDDVKTTGATLNELARTLKKHNANKIYAWTLAHTV